MFNPLDELEDSEPNPEARRAARKEYLDLAEDEQIAEGDISVSETVDGHHPLPDLDDRELDDDIIGEDDLMILDEDDPELGLSDEAVDRYINPEA